MRILSSGLTLGLLVLAVAVVTGACSVNTTTPGPAKPRPTLGAADRTLAGFDAAELAKALKGGQACRVAGGGGSGSDESVHREWVVTCPRLGDDRTIYFLLTDAIEAELRRIATVPSRGGNLGTAQDPVSTVWEVRGNAYLGSVHALGVNGNASLSIFVSLDLLIP